LLPFFSRVPAGIQRPRTDSGPDLAEAREGPGLRVRTRFCHQPIGNFSGIKKISSFRENFKNSTGNSHSRASRPSGARLARVWSRGPLGYLGFCWDFAPLSP
jgi:hypothetical protein